MTTKKTYILVSVILTALVSGLIGWSLFIGKQQQNLSRDAHDDAYINTGGSGAFGGVFGGIANTVANILTKDDPEDPPFQPVLQQLHSLPVAGFAFTQDGTVRFVDRATGHVFEKGVDAQTAVRIEQTTTPRVYEATFVNNARGVIRRSTTENEMVLSAYSTLLPDTEDTDGGDTTFLPAHISSLVTSPDSTQIAYVLLTQEGSSVVLSNADGGEKKEVFRSALRGWSIQWEPAGILITQKASRDVAGTSLFIPTKKTHPETIIDRAVGLETLLSPDGERVLFSSISDDDLPTLKVLERSTGEVTPLFVIGLASKCVWADDHINVLCALADTESSTIALDEWYQGILHFADSLWKIDIEENLLIQEAPISLQGGLALDMVSLTLNEDGSVLLFKNKTDQTLWALTLSEPTPPLIESAESNGAPAL